jgi:soluble lytic murein transglycosylase
MKWQHPLWVLLLLVAGALAVYWWWDNRLESSQDGPILAAAQRYGLEPALVKAVVWQESRFNPNARGKIGEIGLMQIQEETAREWAEAERVSSFEHEHCFDPATNTLAGAWYLKKLTKRYLQTDNPAAYALADYNAGRGNLLKWNKGEAATNSALFIEAIGFPGTKAYVQSVLRRYERYRPVFRTGRSP